MSNGVNIDITANVARFSSTLDRATQQLNRFETNSQRIGRNLSAIFSGLGVGLSVGGFAAIIKNSINTADALSKMADKTGIAVEQLNGLSHAAELSDTSLETVGLAVNRLSVFVSKYSEDAKALGITSKDNAEAFAQLADTLSGIDDAQTRAAVATKILGRGWQELAPLLLQGGDAIRQQVAEGNRLIPVTTEMARQAAEFNDDLTRMKARLSGVAVSLAGPVLDGFNQLINKINEASGEVKTFNSVFTGIGNFAFNVDGIRGLSVEIDNINNKIVAQKRKIDAIRNNSAIGGLIDDIAGIDINVEKNRLDDLLVQREKIINDFHAKQNRVVEQANKKPTGKQISDFISGDGESKGSKKSSVSAKTSSGIDDGERELQNLQRQIALFGEVGEAARVRYEIESGALGKISKARQDSLLATAEQLDAYREFDDILTTGNELAEKQRDSIKSTAEQANRLKLELADLSLPASNEFEERLYKVDDALKAGIISAKEAKIELDKLGKLQNAGEFDDVKDKVSKLSEFAVQASRNLQTSLAGEIRSGFADGLDGALESFTNFLADAAAEYAASGFLELIAGKDGKSGLFELAFGNGAQSGLLGNLFSGFFADGGRVSGGKPIVVGERGPELFVPNTSGTIVPNNRIGSSSVSGGGTTDVSISTYVNVQGGSGGNNDNMAALGRLVNQRIRETIVTEKRPGGLLA